MNQTPHDPGGGGPVDDGHGRPGRPAAPSPATGPIPPDTDLDGGNDDYDDDYDDDDYDDEAERPPGRRFLSGGRLIAVGVAVVVVGSGLALVLTGGGGGGNGAGARSSGQSPSVEEAAFRFAECMREHGLEDFPDPQVTDQGISFGGAPSPDEPESMSSEEREAGEACEHLIDDAGPLEGEELSPEELAERQDQALAMARCMRDRGWDMPDPEVSEEGDIMIGRSPETAGIPGPGDPRQDEFRQDHQECMEASGLPIPEGGGQQGQRPHREGS